MRWIHQNNKIYTKLTYNTNDGTDVIGYNITGDGYNEFDSDTGLSNRFISSMYSSDKGIIPKTIAGSDSTYYTDGCWYSNRTGYAMCGGGAFDGTKCGSFTILLDLKDSHYSSDVGVSLSCKPLLKK